MWYHISSTIIQDVVGQHVAETEELLGSLPSKVVVQHVVEPVLWINM